MKMFSDDSIRRSIFCCLVFATPLLVQSVNADDLTFERNIRPILRAHCFDCHGATAEPKGGLDLRQVRKMETGGESGTAIIPGNADESLLLQRVVSKEMPPGEMKLTPKELETLTHWISAGAKPRGRNRRIFLPDWESRPRNERSGHSNRSCGQRNLRFEMKCIRVFETPSMPFCWLKCRKV